MGDPLSPLPLASSLSSTSVPSTDPSHLRSPPSPPEPLPTPSTSSSSMAPRDRLVPITLSDPYDERSSSASILSSTRPSPPPPPFLLDNPSSRPSTPSSRRRSKSDDGSVTLIVDAGPSRKSRGGGRGRAAAAAGEEDSSSVRLPPLDRWNEVRRKLICSLCPPSTLLRRPYTLPCGHTLCDPHSLSTSASASSSTSHRSRCPTEGCTWTPDHLQNVEVSPDVVLGKVIDLVVARGGGDADEAGPLTWEDSDTEKEDEDAPGSEIMTETIATSDEGEGSGDLEGGGGTRDPMQRKATKRQRRSSTNVSTFSIRPVRPKPLHTISASDLSPQHKRPTSPAPLRRINSHRSPSSSSRASSPHPSNARGSSSSPRRGGLSSPPSSRRSGGTGKPLEEANSLAQTGGGEKREKAEQEMTSLMDCDVCRNLLYEPATTGCGHTFCRRCIARSLDHSSKCPLCRSDLPVSTGRGMAVNKALQQILTTAFPSEYADRKLGVEQAERDARMDIPIFVCTLAFPFMPTILHVFEPRYRLMLRRCIESSSPRFGMVLPPRESAAGATEYGTMLEIRSVQMLNDGRSMIETVGSWRFKVLEKGTLDGYSVGRVERIDDISPEEEAEMERVAVARGQARNAQAGASSSSTQASSSSSQPSSSSSETPARDPPTSPDIPVSQALPSSNNPLFQSPPPSTSQPSSPPPLLSRNNSYSTTRNPADLSTTELMVICQEFVDHLRSGSAPWLLQRLNNTYGPMPSDPSVCGYWMASVIPIDEYEKAKLLPIRSPRLRLALIVHWVEQLRSSWWFSRYSRSSSGSMFGVAERILGCVCS